MPDSKPNARRAATPQPALDAALADKTGAPLHRALWLDALDQQLRPLLPAALAAHCRLANVTGEQLVFVADSPVWRAKLRLAEAELIDAARVLGLNPRSIAVKTAAAPPRPPASAGEAARQQTVSATARQAVREALASLQDPVSTESPSAGRRRAT